MNRSIALSGTGVALDIKRLVPHAILPRYQSERASGMDLHAAIEAPVIIAPGAIELIPAGIAIAVPDGYEAQIRPRSGLSTKHAIGIPNAPGTIDADYRGPVMVALINLGKSSFTVQPEMRIAQMVICPVAHCTLNEVDALDDTARGAGGFGSTGT